MRAGLAVTVPFHAQAEPSMPIADAADALEKHAPVPGTRKPGSYGQSICGHSQGWGASRIWADVTDRDFADAVGMAQTPFRTGAKDGTEEQVLSPI